MPVRAAWQPSRVQCPIIATAADAYDQLVAEFALAASERLIVLHLDAERRLLGVTRFEGALVEIELSMRAIVYGALRLNGAAMILAHNHPSGSAEPSAADVAATRTLSSLGRPLGILVDDHLIFGGDACVSLRGRGLL